MHQTDSRERIAANPTSFAGPAPANRSTARDSGRAALVFRPAERLHLGDALRLTAPLSRLGLDRFERSVLLLDYGLGGSRPGNSRLTDAGLDRLACLADVSAQPIAVASWVPSIARLAAVVAMQARFQGMAEAQGRTRFADILLAAGLSATRCTHAVVEAGGPEDLLLTRKLAATLEKVLPGSCPQPMPLLSGFAPFRALDGQGFMGESEKGTLYITDTPEQIRRKVRTAKTDGRSGFDSGAEMSPEVCNLFLLLHALTGESMSAQLGRLQGLGYSRLKDAVADAAIAFLAPIQGRREALLRGEQELVASLESHSAELDRSAAELADTFQARPELLAA